MMRTLGLLLLMGLVGCATGVSGPRAAPDGTFVVSVSNSRMFRAALEPMDEALAEARFKCWSDQKSVAVVSHRVDGASGAAGLSRMATLRFRCAGESPAL